ncbi:MAG: hypothetical protein ACLQGJ_09190 [Candidatus Dormibacteria bacterium]
MNLRTLSIWGYVLAFGSLFGVATFGYTVHGPSGSAQSGLFYLWLVTALIGSSLVGYKDYLLGAHRLRTRITLGDGVVLVIALVLLAVLPSFMGIVRGLILLVLFTPYMVWWFRQLETMQSA